MSRPDLEFHGVLSWHVDAFEDFGVLSHSSRPQFALEHSEVTVFKSVATPQLCGDLVQELLDNLFQNHWFLARPIAGTRPRCDSDSRHSRWQRDERPL